MLGGISAILGLTPLGFIPVGPTKATIMHIPVIIGAIVEGPVVGALVGLIFGIFSIISAITSPTPVSFVFYNPLVSVLPRILIGIASYYSYALFKKLGRRLSTGMLALMWLTTLVYLISVLISEAGAYTGGTGQLFRLIMAGVLVAAVLVIGYLSYRRINDHSVEVVVSAAVGTLTNTIGVLGMIYILYARQFVENLGGDVSTAGSVIMGIGTANGVPEIIVAMLIVTSVVMALNRKK